MFPCAQRNRIVLRESVGGSSLGPRIPKGAGEGLFVHLHKGVEGEQLKSKSEARAYSKSSFSSKASNWYSCL